MKIENFKAYLTQKDDNSSKKVYYLSSTEEAVGRTFYYYEDDLCFEALFPFFYDDEKDMFGISGKITKVLGCKNSRKVHPLIGEFRTFYVTSNDFLNYRKRNILAISTNSKDGDDIDLEFTNTYHKFMQKYYDKVHNVKDSSESKPDNQLESIDDSLDFEIAINKKKNKYIKGSEVLDGLKIYNPNANERNGIINGTIRISEANDDYPNQCYFNVNLPSGKRTKWWLSGNICINNDKEFSKKIIKEIMNLF